jgi:hypothetical protein
VGGVIQLFTTLDAPLATAHRRPRGVAGSLGGEARHSVVAFSAAETVHANQCSRLLENTFQRFAYLGLTVGWTELVLRHAQQTAPTEERVTPRVAAKKVRDDGPQEFIR